MKIISTDTATPESLSAFERDMVYNGLDCCITSEVLDALLPQLDSQTTATYTFSRELQAPVLEMKLRGVKVDTYRRQQVLDQMFDACEKIEQNLEAVVFDGLGLPHFNWRSNDDLKTLFYDTLGVPPIRKRGKPTADREALERIQTYTIAEPLAAMVIALKELGKKIGVLRTAIDPDGRIRTSYNIAGTSTGRFSSSFSEFGTGGNLQNIEESLRSMFVADPKYKFCKLDAKSGESFCVGAKEWNLFRDDRYLNACETGDPHTAVARLVWPKLGWTGDLAHDKSLAEQPFYRHYTYRFMCKKLGHGSNYGGKPATLAQQSRLAIGLVNQFQPLYFGAFPGHLQWQEWVANQLRRYGTLDTLTGRRRQFWGRRNDDSVLREAIAYDPQGSLADLVNLGMLRVWRQKRALLMMQDHDATTWMYPEEMEDEIVPWLLENLVVPHELEGGRQLRIPYDAQVGFNKGKYHPQKNPDGLKDYNPSVSDKRKRQDGGSIIDRIITR